MVSAISPSIFEAEIGRFRHGCYEICYEVFRAPISDSRVPKWTPQKVLSGPFKFKPDVPFWNYFRMAERLSGLRATQSRLANRHDSPGSDDPITK